MVDAAHSTDSDCARLKCVQMNEIDLTLVLVLVVAVADTACSVYSSRAVAKSPLKL